jgi:hypothetical protein
MATPIKETPVLTGKSARRFESIIKDNETKRISPEERERIMAIYHSVKIIDKRDNVNYA